MAARNLLSVQNYPQLQRFVIRNVRPTGKKLGVGSYGSVEEVMVNGVVCAGKITHEALLDQGNEGVQNIARKYVEECELLSDMRHPHIVQFIGLCFLPGSALPMLTMERLLMSLDDLLENTPDIPLALKRSILADTCKGLVYLHNHSPPVIHRDLSAKNVLLNSAMVAKISDLGNSRIVHVQPGQLAKTLSRAPGTMVYMAPEALYSPRDCDPTKSRYGTRIDIFSFGHLALFTLIQEFPQDLLAPTQADPSNPGRLVALTEVERRKDYIDKLHQQLGEGHTLVRMVKQCLHNEPAQRPTADEVLQQLEGMRIQDPYRHLNKLEMINLLQRYQSQILQMQQQAHQSEGTIEALQTRILELVRNIIVPLQTKVEDLRSAMDQTSSEVEALTEQVSALNEDNTNLGFLVSAKEMEISAKTAVISAKDAVLQSKEEELSAKRAEITAKTAVISAKDAVLQSKEEELSAKRAEITAKDAVLQSKERIINSLRMEVQTFRSRQVPELGIQLQSKEKEDNLQQLRADLERKEEDNFKTCEICLEICSIHEFVAMPACTDSLCKECFKQYFTISIREETVKHFNCPICGEPDLANRDETLEIYQEQFVGLIKEYTDHGVYWMCLAKFRNFDLSKDPGFLWCAHDTCRKGFMNKQDRQFKKIKCPYCNRFMCCRCKKPWERQHDDFTCEAFIWWKIHNHPATKQRGLASYLETMHGIECPACHMRYNLARGGCMHFKCTQCPQEFCSGCGQSFKNGLACGKLESCAGKGFHVHHPRDCFFYLRDLDVLQLQAFLRDNISFNREFPQQQRGGMKCIVMLQKELPKGLVDDPCGRTVAEGHAGLCEVHYKEYLVLKINQAKLDPITLYKTVKIQEMLMREEKDVPMDLSHEDDKEHRERLIRYVQEELPLHRVTVHYAY